MAKVFFYHGQGVGLGGIITRPVKQTIDTKAGASLPITGGRAYCKSDPYRVPNLKDPDIISIDGAETEITGALGDDGVYRTSVTTTVTGVNVGNVVTADTVVAKLVSEHYPDEPEPRIDVTGSGITNMLINGQKVDVVIDNSLFSDLNTFSKFKNKFDKDSNFKKDMRQRFLWGDLQPDQVPDCWREQYDFAEKQKSLPKAQGIVPCSVATNVSGGSGFQKFRHILVIPNFGCLFLGEVLMQDFARRLTMMRFKLGSPQAGDVTVASADANGANWP
jgi:hypothetical protein